MLRGNPCMGMMERARTARETQGQTSSRRLRLDLSRTNYNSNIVNSEHTARLRARTPATALGPLALPRAQSVFYANNILDKCLWQQQVEDNRDEQEHQQRMDKDKQERLNQECINEEEETRKEECKKNKFKYIPILWNSGIPNNQSVTPCLYALRKLDKGEYLELWYFMNDGLDEASNSKTTDDDAMILLTLADGSNTWVSAASTCNTCLVIKDEDLSFEEFCQACPRFLEALEDTNWPQDWMRMMALFWRNLQVHKYRSL
ncbi:uncharacterized protein BJ212DRAFT_1588639 [Suillus subaureus]|uniref:Uncharacterized protein n=1 Tax=Suillus subaureus TaxID=48587 RepID=A0A9P7JC55_9AGAM|nr:uncharacterized protein BJ212DRAFT_1588639 [Suillus subaureus]KAG1813663.1 hypothetical protein BJ212DRAFT_1588639 [Suillus subaureus]